MTTLPHSRLTDILAARFFFKFAMCVQNEYYVRDDYSCVNSNKVTEVSIHWTEFMIENSYDFAVFYHLCFVFKISMSR